MRAPFVAVLPVLLMLALMPRPGMAQDTQTLADIRQDLSILYTETQRLRRELSTSGGSSVSVVGGSALERLNAIESELQRLTAKTEKMEFRIESVVRDATNRIGDLEFRLVEAEGGDVSKLGETTTLGGAAPAPAESAPSGSLTASDVEAGPVGGTPAPLDGTGQTGETELAVGEETDFRRASEALANGDFRSAADLFAAFSQTYPGGPLEAQARLGRGKALEGLGETKAAATLYLDAFSAAPDAEAAPDYLTRLGSALVALGQREAGCQTLGEVGARYPDAPVAAEANAKLVELGCP